jgi:hypothetical protein
MNSFELDIVDEKSRAGSEFMARVITEIQRALANEKLSRKLTQQSIAEKIGTSRAVINRQVQGFENLSARRIGELLWAIGWEPYFEARKPPMGENQFVPKKNENPQRSDFNLSKGSTDLIKKIDNPPGGEFRRVYEAA